jgi:hypothetical protein
MTPTAEKTKKLRGIHRQEGDPISLLTKIRGGEYSDRRTDTDGYIERQTAR